MIKSKIEAKPKEHKEIQIRETASQRGRRAISTPAFSTPAISASP